MTKTHCKHGHEFTPENTYFNPNGGRNKTGSRTCRTCMRAAANRHRTKYLYGICKADLEEMKREQQNRCAICSEKFGEGRYRLCIDHDHTTGEVRGLLCNSCNTALGLFYDDPGLLGNALQYLQTGVKIPTDGAKLPG